MNPRRYAALAIASCLTFTAAYPVSAQGWDGAAAIALRVTDEDGRPIADAQIIARVSDADDLGPPPTATDSGGRAVVSGLKDGEWFIEVSHPGYMLFAAYVNLRAGKKPVVGFSSQVNTATSWSPMTVKFQKASAEFRRSAPKRTEPKPPRVVRESAPPPATPPVSVVRPEPEPPKVIRPEPETSTEEAADEPELGVVEPEPTAVPRSEPPVPIVDEPIGDRPVVDEPVAEIPVVEEQAAAAPQVEPQIELESEVDEAPIVVPEPEATIERPVPQQPIPAPQPSVETRTETPSEPPAPVAAAETADMTDSSPVPVEPPFVEETASDKTLTPPVAAPVATPADVDEPELQDLSAEEMETTAPASEHETVVEEPEAMAPSPSVPEPIEPAVAAAEPAVKHPMEPEPTAAPPAPSERAVEPPPAVEPEASAAAITTTRMPRFLRSAASGSCSECQPGEWAVAAEQEAARAGDTPATSACTSDYLTTAREMAQRLADEPGSRLEGYVGPILTALFRLDDSSVREELQDGLGSVTDPESNCQMAGIVLPPGTTFSGYVLEAWDKLGGRGCRAGMTCAVGRARWLEEPEIVVGAERSVVYSIFKNRSTRRPRRLRMTIYFTPDTEDWAPRTR